MRTAELIVGAGTVPASTVTDARAGVLDAARRLWTAGLALEWRVLGVVPVHEDLGVAEVARAVHRVGVFEAGAELRFVDGAGLDLSSSTRLARELQEHVEHGGRAVALIDPPALSPSAVPLALRLDAVVLGIQLGRTTRADVERTVAQLRGGRVIGAALIGAGG
jgi:hypothetical protein